MKIVSGGQTGVDRAALDVAIKLGIDFGGWCPKGMLAEDGCIDKRYNLKQTLTPDYETRTEKNVIHSDGTLIICRYKPNVGTLLTILFCAQHGKPVLWIKPDKRVKKSDIKKTIEWMKRNNIETLNCAGPRLSKDPQIYSIAFNFISKLIETYTSTLI